MAISRKGYHIKPHARYCIMGPNGILCTRWEKEYASVRQTFVACDDCLVKNEAYDAEEKAHTSKRVSVIALDNVISKAQFAPRARCGNRIVVVCHFPLQYSAQRTVMSTCLSC